MKLWIDDEAQGLTEHGGGVGASWLTEAGSNLLEDIETVLEAHVQAAR